jgi:uncharacterized membrane protein YtjA (UPF0391 family)
MIRAAIGFFILGLLGLLFGATGFAGMSISIGYILLKVFLVLAILSFIFHLISGRNNPHMP